MYNLKHYPEYLDWVNGAGLAWNIPEYLQTIRYEIKTIKLLNWKESVLMTDTVTSTAMELGRCNDKRMAVNSHLFFSKGGKAIIAFKSCKVIRIIWIYNFR